MEISLYDKGTLDRVFMTRPEILAELREHLIVHPYQESPDYAMRVIPGDRRDVMALPGSSIDGRVDEEWFIDLCLDTDEGAAYLGASMFRHFANLVGYCPAEELRKAQERILELENENVRISKRLSRVRLVANELADVERESIADSPSLSGRSSKGKAPDAA